MKIMYWIIGILAAALILFAGYHFWNEGQSTTNTTSGANSSSQSGTGNNNHNPIQEIQKHIEKVQLPLPGSH